jgi:hypothetical protein
MRKFIVTKENTEEIINFINEKARDKGFNIRLGKISDANNPVGTIYTNIPYRYNEYEPADRLQLIKSPITNITAFRSYGDCVPIRNNTTIIIADNGNIYYLFDPIEKDKIITYEFEVSNKKKIRAY